MSQLKNTACVVLFTTFKSGPREKGTYYSRDANKRPGDVVYWTDHLKNLAENTWKDKLKSYAIYRVNNGMPIGEPLAQENYD